MNFLQKLLGGSQPTTVAPKATNQADGRQLLGISNNPLGADSQHNAVYAPVQTPTPTVVVPQQNALSRYGDAQGNQWLENDQGQRFPIARPIQTYDTQDINQQQQFIRPGVTGAYPTGDATLHSFKRLQPPTRIF